MQSTHKTAEESIFINRNGRTLMENMLQNTVFDKKYGRTL